MRVLVACEYSGRVRDAFTKAGHDAISCDLLPTESPGPHYQCDIFELLKDQDYKFDLMIAHPPCTYLTGAAEWAYKDGPYHQKIKPGTLTGSARREARDDALDFVRWLMGSPIKMIAVENPIGCISSHIRKPDQIIQPWWFGDDASKTTCLWLKGLPNLLPTNTIQPRIINGRKRWGNQTDSGQNKLSPAEDCWKERSRTYQGIADAMASQWGNLTV